MTHLLIKEQLSNYIQACDCLTTVTKVGGLNVSSSEVIAKNKLVIFEYLFKNLILKSLR